MAINYGFFESVDGDRTYYSDSFNKYFKGMFAGKTATDSYEGSGVFRSIGDGLLVAPGTEPYKVIVQSGKAMVNYHWYEQDGETVQLTLTQNTSPYSRKDLIVLRCNSNLSDYVDSYGNTTPARSIGLAVLTGTASKNPVAPSPNRSYTEGSDIEGDDGIYEIPLAVIEITSNYTGLITIGMISNDVAPIIFGLLNTDKDIKATNAEYEAKFNDILASMKKWETDIQSQFDTWFYDIENNLTVNGYIKTFRLHINKLESTSVSLSSVEPSGYYYDSDDVFIVTYNGLSLARDVHYSISGTGAGASLNLDTSIGIDTEDPNNDLDITIMKTNIAQRQAGTLSSARGEWFIYTTDVVPGIAYGFKIHNQSSEEHPVISYCNRNIADTSGIETQAVAEDTVSITNNDDGSFTIMGINNTGEDIVFETTVTTRAFAFANTYTISCSGEGTYGTLANEDPAIIFSIEDADDTVIASAYDITGETFETTTETFDDTVKFKITVKDGAGTDDPEEVGMNYTIYPQVECGIEVHDFEENKYGEFEYDTDVMPEFDDYIVYMWPKTDSVSRNFQLIYYVLSEGSADNIQY